MNQRDRERYKDLCELSEIQSDPKKLKKLSEQIYRMLDVQISRLKKSAAKSRRRMKVVSIA
jgi:hypothetical protein